MKYFVTSKISDNIHETPEGFLVCVGVSIARTGSMEYGEGETPLEVGGDGKVLVDRDEDEVFKPETLASFEGKPLTIGHPDDFVTPGNWKDLAKGTISNIRRGTGEQKDDILADVLITDQVAIGLVKSGLREVSCGYEAEYTQTGKGKGKQTNIIGNHLALVDQGRAGSSYAINDRKGDTKMKLTDSIKKIFAKAQDEALKVADEELKKQTDADPDDDKDKSKDADSPPWADALCKAVGDLQKTVASMSQPTTAAADKEDDPPPKKDDDAKDADPMAAMDERMKKIEDAIAQLMGAKAGDEDDVVDEEESEDEDMGGGMVGDEASRIEILAPGLKGSGKDAQLKALRFAYATKDGKSMIEALNNGAAVDFDKIDKTKLAHLFVGASEVLKAARTKDFAKARMSIRVNDGSGTEMTAEKMNEINAKFYKEKGA